MSAASLAFRIIYNFFYYLLYLVLLAFLIVTPADLIQQAVQHHQNYNILVIALCYLVTIIIVAFIYATRLYLNRSVLASIPKPWIPIEKGDVPSDVREMITEGLSRSAAIAYEARPRLPLPPVVPPEGMGMDASREQEAQQQPPWMANPRKMSTATSEKNVGIGINIPPHKAVWGEIEHPGWASPTSPDLPNLQYDTVILELSNLIEAKALTLAPPDPESRTEPPALDPEAVALLQRPEGMGLREYLMHLTDLGVLVPSSTTTDFIGRYESARFSTRPLPNDQFRSLMHLFAEILRNMQPLDPAVLYDDDDDDDDDDDGSSFAAPSESDIDNDAPGRGTSSSSSSSSASSARSIKLPKASRNRQNLGPGDNSNLLGIRPTTSSTSSSSGSSSRWHPSRPDLLRQGQRNSSANTWYQNSYSYRTAPTTPKSRHTGRLSRSSSGSSSSRSISNNRFAQTRQPYPIAAMSSQPSSGSLRSVVTGGSGGSGSGSVVVIRLAGAQDDTDLPYVLNHAQTQ
ncbi:hypothetical protein QBC46DRAFT_369803 [Diplogelasinospora grovesii]|uniref:Defect at low temperature protein 1 n=1 Tax=Diplogelasinospora grovesii TaxID=303347 RepID=A0AAN6NIF7_9PEZI|nr:hypothetical protein QBC46DRAFT_369803 [Diplogelasinospora grovesii]